MHAMILVSQPQRQLTEMFIFLLSQRLEDKALLNLINQLLRFRIKKLEAGYSKPVSGTPQGGVISPI
jgi:hypothetical protein